MSRDAKRLTAILVAIGTLIGGVWTHDALYARTAYVKEQITDTKLLYLKSERRALEQQKFELEVARERRALTDLEIQRLQQIYDGLHELDQEISILKEAKQ